MKFGPIVGKTFQELRPALFQGRSIIKEYPGPKLFLFTPKKTKFFARGAAKFIIFSS